ncbi:hypothetical protein ACNKHO_03160 [Shigella flexneri]
MLKGAPQQKRHTGERREKRVNRIGRYCVESRADASPRITGHIQLIALGGAIGVACSGIGPAIQMAGPAVLLGYAIAGVIAFLIMRQLGEMVVEEPVSGSFAHFA